MGHDCGEKEALLSPTTSDVGGFEKGRPSTHVMNLIIMSIGFFFIFLALMTTQNLETTILSDSKLGSWSLATMYFAFFLCSLFISPSLVRLFSTKWRLSVLFQLSGITFAVYMLGNTVPSYFILIPLAALNGLGSACIWASQGAYLTACAFNYSVSKDQDPKSAMTLFTGIFSGINQFTLVVGNLMAALIFRYLKGPAAVIIFLLFFASAIVGILLFFLLRKEESPDTSSQSSTLERALGVLRLNFKDVKMQLLLATLYYKGIEQSLYMGSFTKTILQPSLHGDEQWIAWLGVLYGFISVISSFSLGKIHLRLIVFIGFVAHGSFLLTYFLETVFFEDLVSGNFWFLVVSVVVYSIGDTVWNVFPSAMMSIFFTSQTELAFSNLSAISCLGYITGFALGPVVPFEWQVIFSAVVLAVNVMCILIFDRFIFPIQPGSRDPTVNNNE